MKFLDVEPRSKEWFDARLGVCTASQFHRIMTPKTKKPSSQAPKYMAELLAEWISGEPLDEGYQSEWMRRGQEVEDSIWQSYESYTGSETKRGGFFTTDDGLIGCSPDRLVDSAGMCECKAPLLTTQVSYALAGGPDEDYYCQVQGQMLVAERDFVDVFSWHPKLFIPPIRVKRNQEYIDILQPMLTAFVDTMLACREKLEREFGPFTRPEPVDEPPPESAGDFDLTDEDVARIIAMQSRTITI